MNNGKICVSVFAENAEELLALKTRAEEIADVVELRFDGLSQEDARAAFLELNSDKQILMTMRPKDQGGHSTKDMASRVGFWMEYALHNEIDHGKIWIDHEHDLIPQKDFMFWVDQCFVVRSRHYLENQTVNLGKAYETVVSEKEVGKIALTTKDVVDAIPLWKLLVRAKEEGKRLIPVAMDEAGKWTRILGPAHGAFLTYATLETGAETAPGQINAEDMIDVFRVRELTEDTAVYGVVAASTGYSASPWMHNAAFKAAGVDAVFVPLQTKDLEQFLTRMVLPTSREVELNFKGFSVTNPHKEAIIPSLDEVDETAAKIGAVNTVKIEDGKLHGYNTDAYGFISTLKGQISDLSGMRVAVFGSGGAARACVHALIEEGCTVTIFARNAEKGTALAEEFGAEYQPMAGEPRIAENFDIAVNTTPLGTAGSSANFTVLTAPQIEGLKLVYDLVYNPSETRLLREAKEAGVPAIGGTEMVIAQGARQFEIWTGQEAPIAVMREAIEKRLATE